MEYYFSHSIKDLSEQLAADLREQEQSIFQTIHIITQTAGMNVWLGQTLANELGIFCNFKFWGLREWLEQAADTLLVGKQYYSQHNSMTWTLFNILNKEMPELQTLKDFFGTDDLLRMELAMKIADVFDQYQAYRPQMITAWNQAKLIYDNNPIEQWQSFLWRELKKENHFTDLSSLMEIINKSIHSQDFEKNQKRMESMPRVYLFGFSTFTEIQISMLKGFSKLLSIKVYLTNYAPDIYWVEDKSEEVLRRSEGQEAAQSFIKGNSLLLNWGKLMNSGLRMFSKLDNNDFFNLSHTISVPHSDGQIHSLLGAVQDSVWHNKVFADELDSEALPINETILCNWDQFLTDGSITIASHFSKKREVEGLYNYLIDVFLSSADEDIKMRDVLVVVNDINAYAPYIRAIFDQSLPLQFSTDEEGKQNFFSFKGYYSIADERIIDNQNILTALLILLNLDEERITAEEILNLLLNPYIRETFNLTLDDLPFLKEQMDRASMRYGWDNNKENDTYLVSLNMGLKRMFLGGLVPNEKVVNYKDGHIVPIDSYDNYQDFKRVVHFSFFMENLEQFLLHRKKDRTLEEWQQYIENLMNTFVKDLNNDRDEWYWKVMSQMSVIEGLSENTKEQMISFAAFKHHLLMRLNNTQNSNQYLSKGITFCSPIPFRSIPFKVIAILGMNDDAFPRKNNPIDFDLMALYPQIGDRNLNANDKQLFLDMLMHAQQKFYLSYIGKDIQDKTEKPPSVLIDKLLGYIARAANKTIKEVKNELVIEHPLWNFDSRYNQSDSRLGKNYLIQKRPNVNHFSVQEIEKKWEINELEISELKDFFVNPFTYYFKKILGIYLESMPQALPETEKFELDQLDKWKIKDEIITSYIYDIPFSTEIKYQKGELPLKNILTHEMNKINEELKDIQGFDCLNANLQKVRVGYLQINDLNINGVYQYLNEKENYFCYVTASNDSEKTQLDALVHFLFAQKEKGIQKLIYIASKKTKNIREFNKIEIEDITEEKGDELIKRMLDVWKKGRQKMIGFIAKWASKKEEKLDEDVIYKWLAEELKNDGYYFVENVDYLKTLFELEVVGYDERVDEMRGLTKELLSYFKKGN